METIYERIKEIRTRLGISQAEFSEQIFVSKSLYGDIEIGKRNVTNRIIYIISKVFNANEEWIRTGRGEMFMENMHDIRLEKLLTIYSKLNNSLKNCLVEQSGILLKVQNESDNEKAD